MLKCDYCDYTSKRKHNLNRHIELTHLNINTTTDNRIIEYICNNCNKKFASNYSLKRHISVCKNVINCEKKAIQCEKKAIQNEKNTIQNEENTIQNEIIFNCSKCGKQYKTKKSFIEHEKNV